MNQAEVVECVLVVANENRAALGKPTQGALDDPTARLVFVLATRDGLFLANLTNVRRVPVFRRGLSPRRVVVSLIETKVLGFLLCRFRTFHDDGFDGGLQQLGVVDVRTVDYRAERTAILLDDYAALRPRFAAIRGISARFFPPKRALASAPSADCHSQLRPPSSSHSRTNSAQMRSITPCLFQR